MKRNIKSSTVSYSCPSRYRERVDRETLATIRRLLIDEETIKKFALMRPLSSCPSCYEPKMFAQTQKSNKCHRSYLMEARSGYVILKIKFKFHKKY